MRGIGMSESISTMKTTTHAARGETAQHPIKSSDDQTARHSASTADPTCRFCNQPLGEPLLNLGQTPLANSYLETKDDEDQAFPLRVFLCENCYLVQLADYSDAQRIFTDDYAYFSSYSQSWLEHVRKYTDSMIGAFGFDMNSQVVEIGSNDGYLLQYFASRGIPVLGIEPCGNVAEAAIRKGIPTTKCFFNEETARRLWEEGLQADLLIGNNVLAHVPGLNDFVRGMKILLAPEGVITMEFPHLLQLVRQNQFDTIYHEHFSYFTLTVVERIFRHHGLALFDVEELTTHGGSLRIYARHAENDCYSLTQRLITVREKERREGLLGPEPYRQFAERVQTTRAGLRDFFSSAKEEGKRIACYGAPAKGNTLLNFCGITAEDVLFTVDISPRKQGRFLPGSRVPILAPERIKEAKPDYLLILPWNLRHEIERQMDSIREWGGRFVVPIPEVEVW